MPYSTFAHLICSVKLLSYFLTYLLIEAENKQRRCLQTVLKGFIEEHYSDHKEYILRDPILFGDYKNTFEESEPRLYEDIQDFDAAKALFQEVRYVYASICEEHCVCRLYVGRLSIVH